MSKNLYQVLPESSSAYGYTGRLTSLNAMNLLRPLPASDRRL